MGVIIMNSKCKLTVKDIYIGKPDAKDEILFQKSNDFLDSYVIPPNFSFDDIINKDKMFIYGNKGTGKTALLLFLESECHKHDNCACTSFILFKTQYGNIQRLGLDKISRNIIKTIDIDNDTLHNEQDFEYIWRWILFKHIVEENENYNYGIFVDDQNWRNFVNTVNRVLPEKTSGKIFKFPSKIRIGMSYSSESDGKQSIKPELMLDFNGKENLKEYTQFVSLIDMASKQLGILTRTDIPYYIFVDELEAFYADSDILCRDLRMIRDLILTVKFFNDLFISSRFKKTKLICSIRTEIINSIIQFVPPKEINKIISGFSWPLIWNYSNTNSYAHPIFEIWLRRIELSESRIGNTYSNSKEIYDKWFCPSVDNMPTVTYVLNNTWNKPRDIVRFLNATKNTQHAHRNMYTPGIFNSAINEYSDESLKELKEELNALYSPEEINIIFMCLTGFKTSFSYDELLHRVNKYFACTFLKDKLNNVLSDLYRIGIIGNSSKSSNLTRWEYKGYQGLVFDEDWNIIVHRALWKILSLSEKHGKVATLIEKNNSLDLYGRIVECTVYRVVLGFALVSFEIDGEKHHGSIHISQLSNKYIKNIFSFIKVGDKLNAKVLTYNNKHLKWNLTCKDIR